MASTIKKITFDEYYKTFSVILNKVDQEFKLIKDRQKNLLVWKGFDNYKEFLKSIEKRVLKEASVQLDITFATTRDRWRVFTLPTPVYSAMEAGDITFSKAKLLTQINFDFENDDNIQIAEEIVQMIKSGMTNGLIKELVETKSAAAWNISEIVMSNLAKQHDITEKSNY